MTTRKPWKDLEFIKEIRIKPEDPKVSMWVEFKEDADFEDFQSIDGSCLTRMVRSDRSIQLRANAMYEVEMDYPEDFKKLVVWFGDAQQAYHVFKTLQKPADTNWRDYAEEGQL